MGTVPYRHEVDAHVAFATWLASDPKVIRSRSSAQMMAGAAGAPGVDVAALLRFTDLDLGRDAATTIELLSAMNIRLFLTASVDASGMALNNSWAQYFGNVNDPVVQRHDNVRDPLIALRALLLHGSGLQHLNVTKLDALATTRGGPASPTDTFLNDLYSRLFYRVSYTDFVNQAPQANLAPWCQMLFHGGQPSTFTGRILGLRQTPESYWDFPFLHPTANLPTQTEPTLITDVIRFTLMNRGDKLADPGRLKSSAIETNQLDREDQMRSTAELLGAHAVAIGLLPYIVTDCFFEALLAAPWLKPIFNSALERVSLTARFNRASADVAPYRRCSGPLAELWARFKPISTTIDTIMDKAHPVYAVPKDLWEEMMSVATPVVSGNNAFATVMATPMGAPSRRGTNSLAFRIDETQLLSPLGAVPALAPTYLDRFLCNRLALADMLGGASETRVAQCLKYVLAQIGWTDTPTATRTLHPSLFSDAVLTDGVYSSAPLDAVDTRSGRALQAAEGAGPFSIVTAGAIMFKEAAVLIGTPVLRVDDAADLGMPSAEDPRDYAGLLPSPTAPVDFDSDAHVIPNTADEWARQLGITVGEFHNFVHAHPEHWTHLFDIAANPPTPLPDVQLAITSSRVARLTRATILIGLPGGSLCPSSESFSPDSESMLDAMLNLGDGQGSYNFANEWVAPTVVDGAAGRLTGSVPYNLPGPLPIVYLDSVDPCNLRCIATWQPPTVVIDPMLPSGARYDLLEVNKSLIVRY